MQKFPFYFWTSSKQDVSWLSRHELFRLSGLRKFAPSKSRTNSYGRCWFNLTFSVEFRMPTIVVVVAHFLALPCFAEYRVNAFITPANSYNARGRGAIKNVLQKLWKWDFFVHRCGSQEASEERNKKLLLKRQITVKMRSAREWKTQNKLLLFMKTLLVFFSFALQ